MILDVKIEYFRCKARLVAGGNVIDPPETTMYVSVLSREIARIALTLAALNELPVKVSDIQNDFITDPITEKIWTVSGQ